MKKLCIAALLILVNLGWAQETKRLNEGRSPLTPEQRTELRVKELTLDLDLSAQQQKEIKQLMLEAEKKRAATREEMIAKRKEIKNASEQDRFDLKNRMLDEQIAMRDKMKKILNPAQFEKWDAGRKRKAEMTKKRLGEKMSKRKDARKEVIEEEK